MRAGKLRQRIVIEQDIGTEQDTVGSRVEDWQTILSMRARSTHQSGREFEAARQISTEISQLLVIRFDSRIDIDELQAMRVRIDSSIHRILYAYDPTRRRREIHIHVAGAQ